MKLIDSNLKDEVLKSYNFALGNLYLMENVAISEINEGRHMSVNSADDYLYALSEFYGEEKKFGYISNRINSFSVEALDFRKFTDILKNLKVFYTVAYKHQDEINVDIEKKFCNIPYKGWSSLNEAYDHLNEYIKNKV